jgi:hypothetical protein
MTNYLSHRSFLIMSVITIILLNSIKIFAQQDSIKVTYAEENKDSSDYLFKQKYHYIDINRKNETNLLKIAVQTSSFQISKRGIQIAYEQKLKPSISILGRTFLESDISHHKKELFSTFGAVIESRWYYRLNKKMKYGTSGNNFHNNYLCLGVEKIFTWDDDHSIITTTGWGIQRRLNNIGYLDVSVRLNTGFTSNQIDFEESINLEIGFGTSFKKKR